MIDRKTFTAMSQTDVPTIRIIKHFGTENIVSKLVLGSEVNPKYFNNLLYISYKMYVHIK